MKYDFGVFGSDMRQLYIGEILQKEGYRIQYYGVACTAGTELCMAHSFRELVSNAAVLLGPIPLSKGLKESEEGELIEALWAGKTLIAGCIPKQFMQTEFRQYDYMADKSLTVFNSIATAEGAIVKAIESSSGNISGSNCLIIGYGVCGKTLASRLNGMKANIKVCVRRDEVHAEVAADGYAGIYFTELDSYLGKFDYIFNTVPAQVLGEKELADVNKECVIIDIASAPGGVDYEVAQQLGIKAKLCPGLPGIYAPKASAEAMVKIIRRVKKDVIAE